MNPDFVFFDGQLWPYDEWAKIAPLTLLCPEKEPSQNERFWKIDLNQRKKPCAIKLKF